MNNGDYPIPEQPQETIPGRLSAAGYQTHAAGKMQFHPPRSRNGFERMRLVPEDYLNELEGTPFRGMYRGHGLGGNEVFPAFSAVPAEYTTTHWTIEESIHFLRQRDSGAPFFMWTSFEAPHPPFDPPESYARLYDSRAIPKPVIGEWVGEGEPAWVSARKLICKLDRLDDDVIAAARKHYYAMITNIDYALGRLFGELKSQGLWDDTIIVFTSDHGEMLGDHGLFHKSCFYEPSARVPLIVKPARSAELPLQAGSVCDRPVMLADLYPTFMDMTGCSSGSDEADRDGRSLIGAMSAGDSRILYGYINDQGGMYMVTDEAWKYLYFALDGREQLFHLKEDPRETSDLSTSAAALHQQKLKAFRSLFATRFADHPIVGPGGLKLGEIACGAALEDWQLRRQNPFAWRGPMRYGGHW